MSSCGSASAANKAVLATHGVSPRNRPQVVDGRIDTPFDLKQDMDVHITDLPGNPTVWEEYQQKRKGAAQTTALPGAQEMTHRRSADDIGVSVLGTAECLHADSTTSPIILTLRVPRTVLSVLARKLLIVPVPSEVVRGYRGTYQPAVLGAVPGAVHGHLEEARYFRHAHQYCVTDHIEGIHFLIYKPSKCPRLENKSASDVTLQADLS